MEQIIITHRNGTTLKLNSKENISAIKKATQQVELLGVDVVDISVESSKKMDFYIGDKITVIGRDYTLNTPAKERKISENRFQYDMQFEGVQYDLLRASFNVNIDTTSNQIQDINGDGITGDIKMFLDVIIANANRVFGTGKWLVGTYPLNSKTLTLTFGDSDNCLSVLQNLCGEDNFNTEFNIEINVSGIRTINVGTIGNNFTSTLQYGKGKGIYELTREKVSSSNIITRLNCFGSSKNIITPKYRASKLCLPTKSKSESFLENITAISNYGIWEGSKNFDDIYPHRTGTITSLGTTVFEFIDNSMNFDLNEKNGDGTTKYLMEGAPAKIKFNTGNLAGYEFELNKYENALKKFTITSQTDQNDYLFPSTTTSAFQFEIGDEYVITDIYMPQTYIDAAEAELETKGAAYLAKYSQPLVQYGLTLDSNYFQNQVGADALSNIVWVGDYIPIKDTDLDVDKTIRVKGFTRDLMFDYSYQITIADLSISVSTITRVITGMATIDKVIKINNLNDPARARRNWKDSQEVLNMVFDTEGDFYSEKIKPLSIETSMLSVGAKSMQFGLQGTIFQPNYLGAKNRVVYTGGVLTHYAIVDANNDPAYWNITDGDITMNSDTARYVYAKCSRSSTSASISFKTDQLSVDSDAANYHFLIGILNSVDINNTRALALMYGFTTINGRFIKTGRIQSADGITYFDLDAGEFQGVIKFSSGVNVETAVNTAQTQANNAIANAATAQTAANNAATAANSAQTAANAAQTSANAANTLLSDIASDNKLTAIEKQQTKMEWDSIVSEKNKNDTQADSFEVSKTAYGTAYSALSTYITPLLADLTITSDITGTTFRSNFKAYYDARTDLLNSIATKSKTLADTAQTTANNIQIGGRNLFKKTTSITTLLNNPIIQKEESADSKNGFKLTGQNGLTGAVRINNVIDSNGEYTVSFWLKSNGTGALSVNMCDISNYNSQPNFSTSWQYFEYKFVVDNYTSAVYNFLDIENIEWLWYWFKDFKIEKGNKATDWTPAPEDVNASIATAQNAANDAATAAANAQTSANTANTEISNISSDNILSKLEKSAERNRWNIISAEKSGINSQSTTFGITTENTTYNTAFQSLANYLNAGSTWSTGIPSWISDANLSSNTTIVGSTYRSTWESFYASRQTLMNAISVKAKTLADNAQTKANSAFSNAAIAQTTADNAATSASNAQIDADTANALLVDIASDNKLTPSEKQALKLEWNLILNEKPKNNAQANVFGLVTTAYDNNYENLSTYITPLLANLTTTSDIIGTTLRTNFQLYYNSRVDLLNAISARAKSLADTAQSSANTAQSTANNIQVGGRNLLPNSGKFLNLSSWQSNGSTITLDETNLYAGFNTIKLVGINGAVNTFVPRLKADTEYTISALVKGNSALAGGYDSNLHIQVWTDELPSNLHQETALSNDNNITTNWRVIKQTFKTPNSATAVFCRFYFYPLSEAYTLNFAYVKLEQGNKASDWTPAPEDVDAAVLLAQTAADNAQIDADTANALLVDIASDNKLTPSEKQALRLEWNLILNEKPKNNAQANVFGLVTTAYDNNYTNLSNYITPLLASLTTTSDIIGTTLRITFQYYYNSRVDLLTAISARARALANTAQSSANTAQSTANTKAIHFTGTSNPTPPYVQGRDIWTNGVDLYKCAVTRGSGSYIANDFVKATGYDNTKTVIDGGIVTSGTLQVAGDSNILAGITGQNTGSAAVRIWAGASFANRDYAPFKVQQDGKVYMSNAEISGKITASSGFLGDWRISGGGIINDTTSAYIIGRQSGISGNSEARIGSSVLSPSTGLTVPAYLTSTIQNSFGANIALIVEAANGTDNKAIHATGDIVMNVGDSISSKLNYMNLYNGSPNVINLRFGWKVYSRNVAGGTRALYLPSLTDTRSYLGIGAFYPTSITFHGSGNTEYYVAKGNGLFIGDAIKAGSSAYQTITNIIRYESDYYDKLIVETTLGVNVANGESFTAIHEFAVEILIVQEAIAIQYPVDVYPNGATFYNNAGVSLANVAMARGDVMRVLCYTRKNVMYYQLTEYKIS